MLSWGRGFFRLGLRHSWSLHHWPGLNTVARRCDNRAAAQEKVCYPNSNALRPPCGRHQSSPAALAIDWQREARIIAKPSIKIHPVDLGRRSRFERLKLKTAGRYPSSLEPSHWGIKFRIYCKAKEIKMETPDLRRHGPRASVLAAIVRLLELTVFRDGNSEYVSPMEPLV